MKDNYMLYLSGVMSESKYYAEEKKELENYMFFSNLENMKEKIDALLKMDRKSVDKMLSDGHDWASEHIATSKDDVEEVYNWLSSESRKKNEKKTMKKFK
jgi:hypothetical protein